jgi:type I restriction enzyme S subunit
MGTVGRSCVVPTFADGWLMTYHLLRVSVNPEKVMSEFVAYCFHGAKIVEDQIREKGRGATREGVNSQILRELRLPLPQLTQQKQIVAYLNFIQSGVDEMQQRLGQKDKIIDQLEQSILQQAFRGAL